MVNHPEFIKPTDKHVESVETALRANSINSKLTQLHIRKQGGILLKYDKYNDKTGILVIKVVSNTSFNEGS